jgi:Uma2 family endonuclease
MLVLDPNVERSLIERRRACRGDRFDEVWAGTYVIVPSPDIEHQRLVTGICCALMAVYCSVPEVHVYAGVNVTDQFTDWKQNYRCPDIAVVLPDSRAVDRYECYYGGPDFIIEIASHFDRSREKFDFYASVGVREFLLVDRNPWQLELYALRGKKLSLASRGDVRDGTLLTSQVLPVSFRLIAPAQAGRPQIEIVRTTDGHRWLA